MKTTIGLEIEGFCRKGGEFVLCPDGVASDGYPLLAEARGLPNECPYQAVASVYAELDKIRNQLRAHRVTLLMNPLAVVPVPTRVAALRKGGKKSLVKYGNLYGYQAHTDDPADTHLRAGLHISFVRTATKHYVKHVTNAVIGASAELEYCPVWDFTIPFRHLDYAFEREIIEAGRRPGFFEIKDDGRIEYRSLPNNINRAKLTKVLASREFRQTFE